ncbi:MAG: hypothetical protein IKA22_04290, partial [Lentisphaeria bacterium]|nr:hypothetical protein [Lentisphaeria bacterium]
IFRRISHIGVLSLIAIAIHYTPNPSIFSNYQSMFSTEPFELLLKLPRYKKWITFIGYDKSNPDKSVCKKGCGEKKLYS